MTVASAVLFTVLFITAIIILNTLKLSRKKTYVSDPENPDIDISRAAEKLSEAVKIPTISYADKSRIDFSRLVEYRNLLKKMFPLLHDALEQTIINDYSLIYKWQASDPSGKPILLMSHMDVVPVEESTADDWTYAPFSGRIKDGYVWGRGAIDTKVTMISIMESIELLIEKGHVPDRDIYLAFGHDEEIHGFNGGKKIAEYFKEHNVRFEFTIDEGGIITNDSITGVNGMVALVGIGEKGYADLKISVEADGGHASMPSGITALGQLAKVIANLEKHQMKPSLQKPVIYFLKSIAPYMKISSRIIIANLWIFKPLFMKIFLKSKTGNALLRTTTAVTMANAGSAPNVLPQKAYIIVNHRIAPHENIDTLLNHIKSVNKNIPLEIEILKGNNPSKISGIGSSGFNKIAEALHILFKDVIVAPYLVMAATDSRYMEEVSDDVYRFAPILLSRDEISSIHSTNERISVENIKNCIMFFTEIISG
ncbi:MAG: M20 family peptidase [Spirochaetes bacterium]|nr:M20 family peptidase [Spirochaetota bacterium]